MFGIECWNCYWGWPKPVADIYQKALADLKTLDCDEMPLQFGPGHIVWSDENWDCAGWCLEHFDEYKSDRYTEEQHAVVRRSLEELKALPESAWNVEPADYDGEHPENYPPAEGVVMVKV